ncbi:AraC family transcriptional regulator [Actinokineospora baliensis]|uniref:helix-turn-helix domain-containing protein n=1 Tax=Actinokineospora baliensis TaxID=547056 RepID=UPI00195D7ADE|nr:AraC family transcriptional regulator [Actinokineospora baliensis]MBM7774397.1 AraC family transcriptional regulator [Actinokineospora baliensis]
MVFDPVRFDLQGFAGFEMERYVRRTFCSWEEVGWRSLMVQRFEHVPVVEGMVLPGTAALHVVVPVSGRAEMVTRSGGRGVRQSWVPGRPLLSVPGESSVRGYRGTGRLVSVQVHIPRDTVDAVAARLGGVVDYEAMAAAVVDDRVVAETARALADPGAANDLYAESAAAFLATHLLTRHRPQRAIPVREDTRVRAVIAVMRERLADPITLADLGDHVHLSVFHLVRVFRAATGETPHRYLTRLRIEEARRLLRDTDLALAQIATRCGFASPGALSTAFVRHVGVRPSVYRNF